MCDFFLVLVSRPQKCLLFPPVPFSNWRGEVDPLVFTLIESDPTFTPPLTSVTRLLESPSPMDRPLTSSNLWGETKVSLSRLLHGVGSPLTSSSTLLSLSPQSCKIPFYTWGVTCPDRSRGPGTRNRTMHGYLHGWSFIPCAPWKTSIRDTFLPDTDE